MNEEEMAKRVELTEIEQNVQEDVTLSQRDFGLVKSVPVTLDMKLGETELTVEKLFSLKAGEVLKLDKQVDQPIELLLDNKVVATGSLVAIEGYFAVEIDSIRD